MQQTIHETLHTAGQQIALRLSLGHQYGGLAGAAPVPPLLAERLRVATHDEIRALLDTWPHSACVLDHHYDCVATNDPARRLNGLVDYLVSSPGAWPAWDAIAPGVIAILHTDVTHHPDDRRLRQILEDLKDVNPDLIAMHWTRPPMPAPDAGSQIHVANGDRYACVQLPIPGDGRGHRLSILIPVGLDRQRN